ncbi:MAG: chalcone isomerase family protein [Idiomarina sp.]
MKSTFAKLSVLALPMLLLTPNIAAASSCAADALKELKLVGETRLSVMFWDVYDARLYTNTGEYKDAEQRALRLDYLRDIDAADLVETTQEEWERLDYAIDDEAKDWLNTLTNIWPNVSDGDCITLVETSDGFAEFYGNDGKLGQIENKEFTQKFLDIWLAEKSRFKDERDELTGVNQ